MMRWVLVLIVVLTGLGASRRSNAAEREVQITLDVAEGDEPTQLCVVAAFIKADTADIAPRPSTGAGSQPCEWSEKPSKSCAYDAAVSRELMSSGVCASDEAFRQVKSGSRIWCSPSPADSPARVLALELNAGVTRPPVLSGALVRLTVDTPTSTKGSVSIAIAGGDYRKVGVASRRDLDDTDRARLPLIPRCVSTHVIIPRYECPDGPGKVGGKPPGLALELLDAQRRRRYTIKFDQLPDALDLPIPDLDSAGGTLRLSTCNVVQRSNASSLQLEAGWPEQPPATITLKPKAFPFQWRLDPLAKRECPTPATLPEVPMECTAIKEMPADEVCRYQCNASIPVDLPTRVQFEEVIRIEEAPKDCISPKRCKKYTTYKNRWDGVLIRAGATFDGYLPPEKRHIVLSHEAWDRERSRRPGDIIESIWIGTPDGKGQFVSPLTPRLFVPGVNAGDSVTYRYIGSRLFKERMADVGRGGIVKLQDPDKAYARKVQPGFAAWGGLGYLDGPGEISRFDPSGGAEFILAVPAFRMGPWGSLYIEPELHIGASVSTQSYESIYQATSSGRPIDVRRSVSVLVVPIELTFRLPVIIDELQIDLGLGLAYLHEMHARDRARVASNIGLSLPRAALLWRVTRTIWLGFDSRVIWDEVGAFRSRRVVETFDLGGQTSRAEPGATMVMFGPLIRFDDVF